MRKLGLRIVQETRDLDGQYTGESFPSLFDEEAFNISSHVTKIVEWITISEGSDRQRSNNYLGEKLANIFTSNWHIANFDHNFVQKPFLIAPMVISLMPFIWK